MYNYTRLSFLPERTNGAYVLLLSHHFICTVAMEWALELHLHYW